MIGRSSECISLCRRRSAGRFLRTRSRNGPGELGSARCCTTRQFSGTPPSATSVLEPVVLRRQRIVGEPAIVAGQPGLRARAGSASHAGDEDQRVRPLPDRVLWHAPDRAADRRRTDLGCHHLPGGPIRVLGRDCDAPAGRPYRLPARAPASSRALVLLAGGRWPDAQPAARQRGHWLLHPQWRHARRSADCHPARRRWLSCARVRPFVATAAPRRGHVRARVRLRRPQNSSLPWRSFGAPTFATRGLPQKPTSCR